MTPAKILHRLQHSERASLINLLHDDLGQCLVAIRSMATALLQQENAIDGETAEIAKLIQQSADDAYRSSYDLMQELRAEASVQSDLSAALLASAEDARLEQNGFEFSLVYELPLLPDNSLMPAMILRSLRCFLSVCRQISSGGQIAVELVEQSASGATSLSLQLQSGNPIEAASCESRLQAMRRRVDAIGGRFELNEPTAETLELRIYLPHFLLDTPIDD